jgi:hypothetical protein
VLLFLPCLAFSIARPLPVGADDPADDGVAVEQRYQPSARGGRVVVEELAAQYFAPDRVPWAVRTARCETGGTFDLYAHSSGFDRRFGVWFDFWGPWQVDAVTWRAKAWELFEGPLSEPTVGAAMAAWIVEHHGPRHWPVCGR